MPPVRRTPACGKVTLPVADTPALPPAAAHGGAPGGEAQLPEPTPWNLEQGEASLDLGEEENDARRSVYLVTIARVLTTTLETTQGLADVVQMSREQVWEAVRDAVDKPDRVGHGRARSGDGTLVPRKHVARHTARMHSPQQSAITLAGLASARRAREQLWNECMHAHCLCPHAYDTAPIRRSTP